MKLLKGLTVKLFYNVMNKAEILKELKEDIKDNFPTKKDKKDPDYLDLINLFELIEIDDNKKAYELYRSFDTYVRDCLVPDSVYNYIYLNRTGEKEKKVIKFQIKLDLSSLGINEPIQTAIKDKEGNLIERELIYECEFPVDASNKEIAHSMYNKENQIREEIIKFDFSEPEVKICD